MLSDPPENDVIEVSIFGPGRGEAIAVHLGDGRWILVDSCRDRSKEVPALSYMTRIGVDVATQVRLVIATHAHNDHFAGLADVFDVCRSAKFVCSSALMSAEFIALTDLEEQDHAGLPSRAYSEYRKIFEIIESREITDEDVLEFAWAQKHLLTDSGPTVDCDVISVSPSNRAFKRAMRGLRKAIPVADVPNTLRQIDANDLAIALWIEAGEKRLLLGADLPKGSTGFGWHAVIAGPRPDAKATIYKVSHHGSVTGHRAGVWSELLVKSPLALLTPYRAGSKTVPNESERRRILSLTDAAYITAPPLQSPVSTELRKEISSLGSLAENIKLQEPVGQVRARSAIGEDGWRVDLAERLKP
jgi:hypothetical protein